MGLDSPIAQYIDIRRVSHVPSQLPACTRNAEDYLSTTEPGPFPDVLEPLERSEVYLSGQVWHTLWILVGTQGKDQWEILASAEAL